LFLSDLFRDPVEFPARTFNLALRVLLLRAAHLGQSFRQPPVGATQDGGRHLQIALEPGRWGGIPRWSLPLRFQKQFRLGQDALAGHPRTVTPSGIQLPGLPRVAVMLRKHCRHLLAVFQADAGYGNQKLHRHMRGDLAFPHLLLNGLRQKFDQRQAPRHPAHAAVEAARQFLQRVAQTLLHLRQQPPLFQGAFLWAEAQRPRQQQGLGFAHLPHRGFHRVPAELFQRRDTLVAVDHQVPFAVVLGNHHHDGRLLAALSQRGQQPALAVRFAHAQMLPAPVQLVKLQLHP
jgi:hypothetical protein